MFSTWMNHGLGIPRAISLILMTLHNIYFGAKQRNIAFSINLDLADLKIHHS